MTGDGPASAHPRARLLTAADYENAASARLPKRVSDFFGGGSGTESTLAANRAAFDRRPLRPRVLVDVSTPDPTLELLGARLSAPVGVAPMAFQRLAHPEGEVATAQAAGRHNLLLVVGMFASRTWEEIAAAASGPLWLQLYWLRRRDVLADALDRAEAAGFQAITLTVDTPRVGRRPRDLRNGFALPPDITAVNLDPAVMAGTHRGASGSSALAGHSREQFDPTIGWRDLAWLRERSRLPVVLKGVLTAEDARLAVQHGAAAVIVSNHGGRQLDGTVASLDVLAEVVDAVAGQCPVLMDGGVRTGADVIRALALGAHAVLVGRPVLWGLAVGGARGAADLLGILIEELEEAMALSGRPRLAALDRSVLNRPPGTGPPATR